MTISLEDAGRALPGSRSAFCSRNEKNGSLEITPYLTTSASPQRNSRSGRVSRRRGVDPDAQRLVEGADQVLGARVIDADLAADGAVDLRQKRRGHHDERKSAQERCGDETGQITDHTAPQCNDQGVAIGAPADQFVVKPLGLGSSDLEDSPGGTIAVSAAMPAAWSPAWQTAGADELREISVGDDQGTSAR